MKETTKTRPSTIADFTLRCTISWCHLASHGEWFATSHTPSRLWPVMWKHDVIHKTRNTRI